MLSRKILPAGSTLQGALEAPPFASEPAHPFEALLGVLATLRFLLGVEAGVVGPVRQRLHETTKRRPVGAVLVEVKLLPVERHVYFLGREAIFFMAPMIAFFEVRAGKRPWAS